MNCLGHANPKVKTIKNQSKTLACFKCQIPEGEKLVKVKQKTFANYVMFQNSGAEATEAIKLQEDIFIL